MLTLGDKIISKCRLIWTRFQSTWELTLTSSLAFYIFRQYTKLKIYLVLLKHIVALYFSFSTITLFQVEILDNMLTEYRTDCFSCNCWIINVLWITDNPIQITHVSLLKGQCYVYCKTGGLLPEITGPFKYLRQVACTNNFQSYSIPVLVISGAQFAWKTEN